MTCWKPWRLSSGAEAHLESRAGWWQTELWFLRAANVIVQDAKALCDAMRAVAGAEHRRDELVLFGIEPEYPDPDLGYIVPGVSRTGSEGVLGPVCAERLLEVGDRIRAPE